MALNVSVMREAYDLVSIACAVLNALNYQLDARTIAFAGSKLLITDTECSDTVGAALELLPRRTAVEVG
jgi:hypothetical protein